MKTALLTFPKGKDFLLLLLFLLIFAVIVLFIGFLFRFLTLNLIELEPKKTIILAFYLLLMPALCEEVFFRVLILPHKTENPSVLVKYGLGAIGLILFIIYHPLNAITFYPAGFPTFIKPIFLLSAAFLGVICTLLYWQSGSLWLPVLAHWIIVVAWLVLFGGYSLLHS